MNFKMVANLLGRILCVEALFLLPAVAVSLYFGEADAARALAVSCVITAGAGGLMLIPRPKKKNFYAREGFIVVALAWIVISLFGALPFYISREIPRFIDCLFETISGFTTTGASILTDIEAMSKGLLYWRSFTHWLGGMGVLVFLLAIAPSSKGSGQNVFLLRAESPGPEVDKLVPRTHNSAQILYSIYIGMTFLEMVFLRLGGMPLFDTVTVTFGTAGTGGFAIRSSSVAEYSPYLQNVVTIFMILFSINFNLYFLILGRRFRQALKNEELWMYLGLLGGSILLIAQNTRSFYASFGESVHHAAFQAASIMTTTGFATVDFNLWPEFSKCILLLLMVAGACAGSTGGGIKVSRLLLLFKSMHAELRRMISPRLVRPIRMDGKPVGSDTLRGIYLYMSAYFTVTAVSLLFVSLDNFGLETTISSVFACLNNIGPGFGITGPMGNYAPFSSLTKLILCADMLIGRLEILPILLLFVPSVWKRT
ncbi:MAG: TrkH family potassium uptake protein [Provencibacterium sp.]|jgi:trk system potassium uptake protein TrkH|nr:TrkH family potassium uptake protein [Provencibacterium sp.]